MEAENHCLRASTYWKQVAMGQWSSGYNEWSPTVLARGVLKANDRGVTIMSGGPEALPEG